MNKLKKIDTSITYTEPKEILAVLNNVIKEVKFLDEDTLYVGLNKNIVLHNNGHTMTINDGLNISIAKEIHQNPSINVDDILNAPSSLAKEIEEANRIAMDAYHKRLEAAGVKINPDGTFDISNSIYGLSDA